MALSSAARSRWILAVILLACIAAVLLVLLAALTLLLAIVTRRQEAPVHRVHLVVRRVVRSWSLAERA